MFWCLCPQMNTTLTSLELNSNNIDYDGATALAEAIKENTSLTALHLRWVSGAASASQAAVWWLIHQDMLQVPDSFISGQTPLQLVGTCSPCEHPVAEDIPICRRYKIEEPNIYKIVIDHTYTPTF